MRTRRYQECQAFRILERRGPRASYEHKGLSSRPASGVSPTLRWERQASRRPASGVSPTLSNQVGRRPNSTVVTLALVLVLAAAGCSVTSDYDVREVPDGVELSFVFASAPAGAGDLVVRLALATDLAAVPGAGRGEGVALHAEGISVRGIARTLSLSRNTVR